MVDSLARALALKFLKGKADLNADGKVPSEQLPSYVSNIVEVQTYADLPAQGEADTIYVVQTPSVTTYRWTGSSYIPIDEKSQYYSVKVSSTNIVTMGNLRAYIDNVNSTGLHCLFDFSEFINNAYVCTVLCFTQTAVNYCVIFDIINGRTYIDYAGYQDSETVQSYVNRLGDNIPRIISIADSNTKVVDVITMINNVNVVGHHILFDFHAIQAGCYLCTLTYDSTNVFITDVVSAKVVKATYDNTTLLSTVLASLSSVVDTNSVQTIRGDKTIKAKLNIGQVGDSQSIEQSSLVFAGNNQRQIIFQPGLYALTVKYYTAQIFSFGDTGNKSIHFKPITSDNYNLGEASLKWKDLYLSGICYANKYQTSGSQLLINIGAFTDFAFEHLVFRPAGYSNTDLGSKAAAWKDFYIGGAINKNTNNYGLTIPDTTSWTSNKEIATTDQISFRRMTPSEWGALSVNEKIEQIQRGLVITGTLNIGQTIVNPTFFPPSGRVSSGWYGVLLCQKDYEENRFLIYVFNDSNAALGLTNNNYLVLEKVGKINDRALKFYQNNVYPYATNSTTTLQYETINDVDLSADTTFTLAAAPANTYPEYKANITNSGASDITITLPSGTTIKGNVAISSNTFVIPAGSTIELNIQNARAIVVEW